MLANLFIPPCHWTGCSRFGKPMSLINEGDGFWFFACPCGCTRAVSKPSTREASMHAKYQQDVDALRRRQRFLDSRPEYSIPSDLGVKR